MEDNKELVNETENVELPTEEVVVTEEVIEQPKTYTEDELNARVDELLAKKIARKKAVRQMFKCYKNSLKNCYDQIINISTEIETSRNSVLRKVDKITDEIKGLNLT